MIKESFYVALSVLLFSAGSYADNTVNLSCSGNSVVYVNNSAASNSLIDLYQVGDSISKKSGIENQITVSQVGSGDTVRIGQGAEYVDTSWIAGSAVTQNVATVNQTGIGLTATVIQMGAVASTVSADQAASVPYTLNVTQSGYGGHSATIQTTSTYIPATVYSDGVTTVTPGVTINQSGTNDFALISGMSGGSALINQSNKNGSVSLIGQTSGIIAVTQSKNNADVSVVSFGSSTPMIINQ